MSAQQHPYRVIPPRAARLLSSAERPEPSGAEAGRFVQPISQPTWASVGFEWHEDILRPLTTSLAGPLIQVAQLPGRDGPGDIPLEWIVAVREPERLHSGDVIRVGRPLTWWGRLMGHQPIPAELMLVIWQGDLTFVRRGWGGTDDFRRWRAGDRVDIVAFVG